jgi:Carboxypeptidase regulatory-like domain
MNSAIFTTRVKRIAAAFFVVSMAAAPGWGVRGGNPRAAAGSFAAGSGSGQHPREAGAKAGRVVTLEVVDAASLSPLPGAVVWVRGKGGRTHTWEGMTDDQGRYVIVPPNEVTRQFDILVACAGYVPDHLSVMSGIPEFRLSLQRAVAIEGVVRDELGRPVEGARVFPKTSRGARVWPEIYASPNSERAIATTDEHGRWRSDALAAGEPAQGPLWVLVTHPDHVGRIFRTTARDASLSASFEVMKAGLSISGTILSPFGRPVQGATVLVAAPAWDGTIFRLTTDKEGRFRSGRCIDPAWHGLTMVVQASGLAWLVRQVAVTPEIPPQVIRLTGRRPLEGRVVDAKGQPVAGALVSNNREALGGLIEWQAETDANGRFVWYDAPIAGKFYLDVFKPTFPPASEMVDRPEDSEVTITVRGE